MKELADEQLNIAICEWRGWRNIRQEVVRNATFQGDDRVIGTIGERDTPWATMPWLPSHITGPEALGNMHEAEKGLSGPTWCSYYFALKFLVPETNGEIDRPMICATARQRGIALLRVVKPELF